MASYSFSSPGYVNIPPYYNTTPNGYSTLNFQYPLPEGNISNLPFSYNSIFDYLEKLIQQLERHPLVV
jgi:hypothetical protein